MRLGKPQVIHTSDTSISGGDSYTLAGFAVLGDEKTWTVYRLGLTNGTLTVNNAKRMRENTARQIWLWNGATLNYNTAGLGAAAESFGAAWTKEQWNLKYGSRMNVPTPLTITAVAATIDSGATLSISDGTFRIQNNANVVSPNSIDNSGMLLLPNGLEWVTGDPWSSSADYSKQITITQKVGEARMGGDFKKTGLESHNYKVMMKFVLQGGTLTTEEHKTVSFVSHTDRNSGYTKSEEVFAEMPASASASP